MTDLYRKYIFTFASRAVAALGLLFMNIVLGRTLGVAGFGLFSFGFIVLMGFGVIVRFGHDNSLMKFGGIFLHQNRPDCFKLLARRSIIFALALGSVAGIILYFFANITMGQALLENSYAPILSVVSFAIIPFALTYYVSALIRAAGKPEIAPFFEVGAASMLTAFVVVTAERFEVSIDVQTALWLLSAACLLTTLAGLGYLNRSQLEDSGKTVTAECFPENITAPNWSFFIMAASGYLTQWFAPLSLAYFSGADSVGLYNAAYGLTLAVGFILFVFNGILSPRIASAYAQGDIKTIEELFRKSTKMMAVIITPIAAVFIIFPVMVLELYGKGFGDAAGIMQLLTLAQVVNVLVGPVGLMLSMTGNEKQIRNIFVASALFSIAASFFLVPFFAEKGAAIAVFISLVFQNLYASYIVYKKLGVTAYGFLMPKKRLI